MKRALTAVAALLLLSGCVGMGYRTGSSDRNCRALEEFATICNRILVFFTFHFLPPKNAPHTMRDL